MRKVKFFVEEIETELLRYGSLPYDIIALDCEQINPSIEEIFMAQYKIYHGSENTYITIEVIGCDSKRVMIIQRIGTIMIKSYGFNNDVFTIFQNIINITEEKIKLLNQCHDYKQYEGEG